MNTPHHHGERRVAQVATWAVAAITLLGYWYSISQIAS
jgi:hypothetical protein